MKEDMNELDNPGGSRCNLSEGVYVSHNIMVVVVPIFMAFAVALSDPKERLSVDSASKGLWCVQMNCRTYYTDGSGLIQVVVDRIGGWLVNTGESKKKRVLVG